MPPTSSRWLGALLWVFVGAAAAPERRGARLVETSQVPLSTSGRYIVDNRGERVKWACVNWYGAYSTLHAVGGLEILPLQQIVNRIVELGFNCVRMMYSTQAYVQNPMVADTTVAANPHMKGMRWLEIFDLTMQALANAKLMIILNNHNSKSGWCCHYTQDEGLWYVPEYSEEQWIDSLVNLTHRYKNNPYMIATDLRNEVHDYKDTHLTWGDGNPKTDWAAAAVRAGERVLAVHPDVIIVVMAMCFGMDLRAMRDHPIQLSVPNKVVYQTHNYLEYQIFENVAKMMKPWHEIRNWTLLIMLFVALPSIVLWRAWDLAGRPKPPMGCVYLSFGLWMAFYMLVAALLSWSAYSFGKNFCKIAGDMDVIPWFAGSLSFMVFFLMLYAFGLWKLRKRSLGLRRGTRGGASSQDKEATADAESSPEAGEGVMPCCSAGVGSIKHAGRGLLEDARRLAFWVISRPAGDRPEARSKLATPVNWDCGCVLGLQCAVLLVTFLAILIFLYVWANILPTYWWMERHLDGLWGFALEEGFPYTAPVWMGEFGQNVRGQYWLNFVEYLANRDVDFAYWALNGLKWAEGYIDTSSGNFLNYDVPKWENESFGLLMSDYKTIRHPWKLLDLQALMDSPARGKPAAIPCRREALGNSCGRR